MNNDVYLQGILPGEENYENKLVKQIDDWYLLDTSRKHNRAVNWNLILNFIAGNQWVQFNLKRAHWETIPYTENQKNIDRPVTNHMLRWLVTNVSVFTSRPRITIDPNSREPRDKMAAKAGTIILDSLWEQLDKQMHYYSIAILMVAFGTCFRKSFKADTNYFIDGTDYYHKKNAIEIVPPYRISVDSLARTWSDVTTVMDTTPRRVSWIRSVFGRSGDGFTGNASKVKEEIVSSSILSLYESTRNIIEGGMYTNLLNSVVSPDESYKDTAVLKEVYSKPCKEYPRGRYVASAAGQLLYDSLLSDNKQSPYYYLNGDIWHPYTRASYLELPVSIWALSLGMQLVSLQRRINQIDALLAYNRKTMAIGQWLIPKGCGIPDNYITGVPGQQIEYDPLAMGTIAIKPEKVPPVPLPNQLLNERELAISEGDMIAFAANLKSGNNPSGVTTLGQMQILQEESQQARSKQIENWEKFLEKSEQLDLLVFQDCYRVPDLSTVSRLSKLSEDITSQDWKSFIGSDLRDNANIRIEPGSTIRESRFLRQNTILNLAQAGILPEIMSDPVIRKNFLDEFNIGYIMSDNNADVKSIEYAIEQMKQGMYPPILDIYNPDIQLMVLSRYMKEPKFLELPDRIRLLFEKRKNDYIMMLASALNQAPLVTGEESGVDLNKLSNEMKGTSNSTEMRSALNREMAI